MGVWNGWGYGIAIFSRSEFFKFRSLKFGKNRSVEFQGFSWKIRPLKKYFSDSGKMTIPYATNPYPPLIAGRVNVSREKHFLARTDCTTWTCSSDTHTRDALHCASKLAMLCSKPTRTSKTLL